MSAGVISGTRFAACLIGLCLVSAWPHADADAAIAIADDQGVMLRLERPARRIVSLSPGHAEMLYAAGAGDRLVGTVEYSDHPEAARALPRVGNSALVEAERIVALAPDLVIAWPHGAGQRQAGQLRRLGLAVFTSDPRSLDALATVLVTFGRLAGTEAAANAAAAAFRERLARLRGAHAGIAPLPVFFQIAATPLMTVNDEHVLSDALRACGARNVFGSLPDVAPVITREEVIATDPEAIVALGTRSRTLEAWRALPAMRAVRNGRMAMIAGSALASLSPRTLDGVAELCGAVETLRRARPAGR